MNHKRQLSILMILALGCVILIGGRAEAAGDAVQRLRQIADGPVETTYSRNSQYPSFIRSRIPITTGSDALDAEAASGQFLADFGDVFGVVDPVSELKLVKDEVDDLGMSHVTYQQVYDGIPVYHATLKAHLSQGNRMVVAVGNGFLASLRANTTAPVLSSEEAIMNAMLALPGGSITDEPALTLYPTKLDGTLTTARLAWLVDIQDDDLSAYNRYVIDAVNGEFIDAINLVSGYHFGEWDAVAPAAADDEDDGRTLKPGNYLTGSISPETDVDSYYFIGRAGHLIAVSMSENAFTSSIDPFISLYGPDGVKLTEDNDGGVGDGAAIRRYRTTQTGTYRIEARTYNERPGLYGIRLTDCPAGQLFAEYYDNRTLSDDPTRYECDTLPISYDWGDGPPFSGFAQDNFSVRWTGYFQFQEGDYRFMVSTDDGVRLLVDNNPLIDDWNSHANTYHDALLTMTPGEHKVEVEYYEYVSAALAYAFWHKEGEDDDDGRMLVSRQDEYGMLSPIGDRDSFYFNGQAGDFVSLRMTGSRFYPSLDPYLRLYGPGGGLVAEDDDSGDGTEALIGRFQLPLTGQYRLEAADLGDDQTGGYYVEYIAIGLYRETYDAENSQNMTYRLVRSEGEGAVGDIDTDQAHDFAGETHQYFRQTFGRFSIDDQGLALISTVHFGTNFQNAQWLGGEKRMRYGDGFAAEDIVAHELTHGITQYTANLEYAWEPGAMNESFSDIFGVMVDRDDWLLGEDLPESVLGSKNALRDLADPSRLGHPDHVDSWKVDCGEDKGVHTNSSIFNKAFYNTATSLGKGTAELIFYRALTFYLQEKSSFEDGRAAAVQSAADLYGVGSDSEREVMDAFAAVGLDGAWNPPSTDCSGQSCAVTAVAADRALFPRIIDGVQMVATLYRVRDTVLDGSTEGRHYRDLYETHTAAINRILLTNGDLRRRGGELLRFTQPGLDALAEGRGSRERITPALVAEVRSFLVDLAAAADVAGEPELVNAISREMNFLAWDRLAGMNYDEAWQYLDSPRDVLFIPSLAID